MGRGARAGVRSGPALARTSSVRPGPPRGRTRSLCPRPEGAHGAERAQELPDARTQEVPPKPASHRPLPGRVVTHAGPAAGGTGRCQVPAAERGRGTGGPGHRFFINDTRAQRRGVFEAAVECLGRTMTIYSVEFLQNEFWDRSNKKL